MGPRHDHESDVIRRYVGLLLLALIAASSAPASAALLQSRPTFRIENALAPGEQAPLDQLIGPREAQHHGQSGFRLVSEGPEAFVMRARSAHWPDAASMSRRSSGIPTRPDDSSRTGCWKRQIAA
jgi:hypothetical protein